MIKSNNYKGCFENGDFAPLLDSLDRDGFVELPEFISPEVLFRVNNAIDGPFSRFTINGIRGYVETRNIRFLFQTFAWSKEVVEIYTHERLIGLADTYSGSPVHLSNHRIYRTFPSRTKRMHWHSDNKIDVFDFRTRKFATTMVPSHKGLIVIAYLSDVENGGLQLIRGSHRWPDQAKEKWSEQEVQKYTDEVVTFNNRQAGTAIIYDYRCVHRAQPFVNGSPRTSLFAQFSPEHLPAGEPIHLSTEYLGHLTNQQARVLNFGVKPTTENWPIGSGAQSILSHIASFLRRSQ